MRFYFRILQKFFKIMSYNALHAALALAQPLYTVACAALSLAAPRKEYNCGGAVHAV